MRKQKLVFILVALLFISNLFAQSGWVNIPSNLPTYRINSVKFINTQTGYIVCGSYPSYKTTNSGLNWISLSSPGVSPNSITVNQTNIIFFVGSGGYDQQGGWQILGAKIGISNNGGTSWNYPLSNSSIYYGHSFLFVSVFNNYGIAGGTNLLVYTSNNGQNWVNKTRPSNKNMLDAKIFSQDSLLILSDSTLYSSINGGSTWNSINLYKFYGEMHFINLQTGFLAGNDITKTTNGGIDWQILSNIPNVTDIDIANELTGYFFTSTGRIYKTSDGGTNITLQYQNSSVQLYGLDLVDEYNAYAVGTNGTILKTTNGGVGVSQVSSEIPEQYSLYQNYPNPFNPSTKINYKIKSAGFVNLKVFDLLGKQVATLVNGMQVAGSYTVDFNSSEFSLPSEIYFYKLQTEDFTDTKKMILVK